MMGYKLPRSTLLLVDHDQQQIERLQKLFGGKYQIELAENGEIALQTAFDGDIDLVLCSAESQLIGGAELCSEIKNNPVTQHIPVIMYSPHPSEAQEQVCLDQGAIDYVSYQSSDSLVHSRVRNHMMLVEQQKVLEHVSCTDGLTGLANRMQLDTTLNRQWYAALRAGNSIALLMIDIDHFKYYNDEYGHLQGDECLRQVADAIEQSKCRQEDFAARYGGEEFVLLLPYTNLQGASQIAAQLLENVRKLQIPAAPQAAHKQVTVSVGVAAMSPKFDPHSISEPTELIKLADQKLFAAKRSGRNKFCA